MTTNGQTEAQGTTAPTTAAHGSTEQDDDQLDDGFYEARGVGFGMGAAGGKGGDQLFIDLEIHHGGKWYRKTKYNNLTTRQGLEITTSDGTALGCLSDDFSEWFASPEIIVTVILETEEYEGKFRQVVKKILPKRQQYKPEVFKSKAAAYTAAVRAARVANAEYQQKKAMGQIAALTGGGRNGGRSNQMPAQQHAPAGGTERDDFGGVAGGGGSDDFGGGDSGDPELF